MHARRATARQTPLSLAPRSNKGYLVALTDGGNGGVGNNLDSIPLSPGGAGNTCRTKASSIGPIGLITQTVILNPVMLPAAASTNNMDSRVFDGAAGSDNSYLSTSAGAFGLPTRNGVGWTLSGQAVFPIYNNRALITPENCEVDACNEHVGGGGGQPHTHGDPFGP